MTSRAIIVTTLGTALLTACPPGEPTPTDAYEVRPDAAASTEDAPGLPPLDAHALGDTGTPEPLDTGAPPDSPTFPVDAGPPDAFVAPESCAAEGMFRRVPCACGGMQSEQCTSGTWRVVVACDGMTECTPGAFETRMRTSHCAVDQRTCADDCSWGEWVNVRPPGECGGPGLVLCTATTNCDCQADCTCRPIPDCPTRP